MGVRVRAQLRIGSCIAADSVYSPPPCWEGLGVGVGVVARDACLTTPPTPALRHSRRKAPAFLVAKNGGRRPPMPPHKGEGKHRVWGESIAFAARVNGREPME